MRQRWKQAGLIFLSLLALAVALFAFAHALRWLRIIPVVVTYGSAAITGSAATIALLVYLAAVRWIERRPVTEFSPSPALPELILGLVAGLMLFAFVIAILWIAGAYQPLGWGSLDGIGFAFPLWLAVGVMEEIEFRGLVYRLCCAVFGTWGAIVVSGVLFGLVHGAAPGATPMALTSVAIAGLMLGAAFALTGRLWFPIGIHAGWNFAEGSLFGTAVSGGNLGASAIRAKLAGPELLAGGRFGPEASIVTVIVLLIATIILIWRVAKLPRVEPPIWRAGKEAPPMIET
ncbi:MAG TPA: CPBP family intramembrane glutamic endopeptidase [Xanthobacteraceae bacterium]|nr:CPBP family intramembrane glutamic endopeptidase [Xanthobacteraceae bacterium]